MARKIDSSTNPGCTIPGAMLGTAFVVLKLCKVIDWSWWWVTCPFWIGPAVAVILIPLIIIVAIMLSAKKGPKKWLRR